MRTRVLTGLIAILSIALTGCPHKRKPQLNCDNAKFYYQLWLETEDELTECVNECKVI